MSENKHMSPIQNGEVLVQLQSSQSTDAPGAGLSRGLGGSIAEAREVAQLFFDREKGGGGRFALRIHESRKRGGRKSQKFRKTAHGIARIF